MELLQVAWEDSRAVALRAAMVAEMSARYADRLHDDGQQAALDVEPESVECTLLAVVGDEPVGHVALRRVGADLELKRMYVDPAHRGRGVAGPLMAAAEEFARSRGVSRLVLQTGDRQPEAVRLYHRLGYLEIPVFSPYEVIDFSLCMAKPLA